MPKIVIAGASGLIGRTLAGALEADGVEVVRLVRRPPRAPGEVRWLDEAALAPEVLSGATAVVNLNGASIGRLPWGARYREELVRSRLRPTRTLAEALAHLGADAPPLISASAVGFYGDRPGEQLDETSGPGRTFLAELCVRWEQEALAAAEVTRVALLRTAPVLHPRAVLRPMIALTRLGLGGPLGRGTQHWPWISLTDEVRAIRHVIDSDLHGPVNLTGPLTATARDIGYALARRLHRPFLLPAPAWALRLALSRAAADSLLLSDAAVTPDVLLASGFTFEHRTVDAALDSVIG